MFEFDDELIIKEADSDCTCWEGYERVPGTKPCASGSCRRKKKRKKSSTNSLVSALEEVLGNVFSMYVRTHGAHWNVRGSDFAQYHELFETIYEDVYSSIDPLAENIRKLDADAPASVQEFEKFDGLSEAPVSGDSEQVLAQDIADANRVVLESLDKAFKVANDENQQGIANFLAERIDMHQKWQWQLTSSMEKESSVKCAACGQDDEFCSGHDFEVDPVGYAIIANHKVDDHISCAPTGCKFAGRNVHAHTCLNCNEQAVCTSKISSTGCEERNVICLNCLPKLARIDHLAADQEVVDGIKDRMRMHTNDGSNDNINDETVEMALGEGHSVEQAREKKGPHRPKHKNKHKHKKSNIEEELEDSLMVFEASDDSSGDSFVPPSSVASNAKRGLALRKKHNRGGTEVGVARARDLSNRKGLSYSTVKRMKAYFDRHEVDKQGEGWGKDSAGYIAWLLWGGDAGRSWANKIVKSREKKKESSVELDNEIYLEDSTELPEWIKNAMVQIEADGKVYNLDDARAKRDQNGQWVVPPEGDWHPGLPVVQEMQPVPTRPDAAKSEPEFVRGVMIKGENGEPSRFDKFMEEFSDSLEYEPQHARYLADEEGIKGVVPRAYNRIINYLGLHDGPEAK